MPKVKNISGRVKSHPSSSVTARSPHPALRATFPQEGKENRGFPSPLGRGQGEGSEQLSHASFKDKGTNVPLVVGLTGGIGAGKSTVSAMLKERGIPVSDADEIVHRALDVGGQGYSRVLKLFGPSVRQEDGRLDRAAMAQRVFVNPRLRKKLEAILHPLVEREFKRRIAVHRRGLLVLDVPLLFESGLDRLVDRTVLVWAPKKVCLDRLASSGRLTRPQALRRMAAQMPLSEKRRRAHFLLDNSGSRAALRRAFARLFIGTGAPPLVYKNVTTS